MHLALFYFFSGIAVLSAFFVIGASKPTRSLLALVVCMFALSVLYLLLGAPFLAMVLLIVYAGAVLVLFLFGIMLQGIGAEEAPLKERFRPPFLSLASIVCGLFLGLLVLKILLASHNLPPAKEINGTVEKIGQVLFQQYLLPFELVSFLLLLGIFAAIALAKKEQV